ncbi:hypothetical protein F4804DRAFT_343253 [Jackrogersella minutella]|nr:hypothetical protein F4804DRAFT_343253 [Jackrogersella minutella]
MTSRANSAYTPPQPRCPKCKNTFASKGALRSHQQKMGHFVCGICNASYHTIPALMSHRAEDHRSAQDLSCPGCAKDFKSTAGWILHIEDGDCSAIFPSDISKGIDNVMNTIQEKLFEARTEGARWIDHSGPSHIQDTWGEKWNDSQKLDAQHQPEAFPRTAQQEYYHGSSKQSDLLTGELADDLEQKPGNAWGQKKKLFPEKENDGAIPPPPSLLEEMSGPSLSSQPTEGRILDPNHPEFNVAVFYNPILETYKCPHKSCKSKFKRPRGLIDHLRSSAHSGNAFDCLGCNSTFTSVAAWVQHVETVSLSKCRVRASPEIYGYALNKITDGALDVDTLNGLPSDEVKVKVVEQWASSKVPSKPAFVPGTNEYANAKQAEAAKLAEAKKPPAKKSWDDYGGF